jgi:uncharacterized membrane protein YhaH (DUF805 family)
VDLRTEIETAARTGFENYVNFEGRAALRPFWMWVVFEIGVAIVAAIIDAILPGSIVGILASLALLLPGLAFGARRLHDTGKSGWYLAAVIIPVIGWIYVIYLLVQPGETQTNAWGPVPA